MHVAHVNKDFDKVKEFSDQIFKKFRDREKAKAEKKYFKQSVQKKTADKNR